MNYIVSVLSNKENYLHNLNEHIIGCISSFVDLNENTKIT